MTDGQGPRRLVVAITGASGAIYGIRALEVLAGAGVETHLVLSSGARSTIAYETDYTVEQVRALASVVHSDQNLAASIASGSFLTHGMLVAPCSIKTLSGVANGYADNLVVRAADVALKERRRLVLMVRETPLHAGHLRLMSQATENGAVILPPVPAFYHQPQGLMDLVDQSLGKALDLFGLEAGLYRRWQGSARAGQEARMRRTAEPGGAAKERGSSAGDDGDVGGHDDSDPESSAGRGDVTGKSADDE